MIEETEYSLGGLGWATLAVLFGITIFSLVGAAVQNPNVFGFAIPFALIVGWLLHRIALTATVAGDALEWRSLTGRRTVPLEDLTRLRLVWWMRGGWFRLGCGGHRVVWLERNRHFEDFVVTIENRLHRSLRS